MKLGRPSTVVVVVVVVSVAAVVVVYSNTDYDVYM